MFFFSSYGIICCCFFGLCSYPYFDAPQKNNDQDFNLTFSFDKNKGLLDLTQSITIHFHFENLTQKTIFLDTYCAWLSNGKRLKSSRQPVKLLPNAPYTLSLSYTPTAKGFYKANFSVKNSTTWVKNVEANFLVNYEDLPVAQTYPPPDFKQFWEKTLDKLAQTPPNYKIEAKEQLSNEQFKVFLITMQSLDKQIIRAWYRVPTQTKKSPVVLQLPSLGGALFNIGDLEDKPKHGIPLDFAVLSVNVRGHGNSKEQFDANKYGNDFITIGITNKENYIYRGIIADCIRALDFLLTRPEIDTQKIIVEGGSQGGGLSLIVAGLDERVKICCPDVPFLCDMPQLTQNFWVKNTLQKLQNICTHPQALQTMQYFDAKFFAQLIKIPVYMSVGLQDVTCPPATCYEAYRQIPHKEKKIDFYLYGKHGGGEEIHRKNKFNWIRKILDERK